MNILFHSRRLQKDCCDLKKSVRRWGARRSKLIRRRLDELRAAETLKDLRSLPTPRCHELKGNRKGQLSVDLDHPYRLIFEPAEEPVPAKPNGGIDWKKVRSILIIGVEDIHG